MIEKMEEVLCRKLTDRERAHIEWLLKWDKETIEAFEGIFAAIFKAGQEDVEAHNEALETGDARD